MNRKPSATLKQLLRGKWGGRVLLLVAGGLLLSGGIGTLGKGSLHYSNYWGGAVFAPFAIVLGIACWLVLLWNPDALNKKEVALRGKAARKAKQAEDTKFPIEDFDKPWNP